MRSALLNHQPRSRAALNDEALFFGDNAHLGDETVTSARNGDNIAMIASRFTKSFPQHEDVLGQIGFLDKGVRPHALHQVILQNHLFAVAYEHKQGLEGLQL
jgi:hypothetical protein